MSCVAKPLRRWQAAICRGDGEARRLSLVCMAMARLLLRSLAFVVMLRLLQLSLEHTLQPRFLSGPLLPSRAEFSRVSASAGFLPAA